jgi:hypothetical protein
MAKFVIINDSVSDREPGDLRVYDGHVNALRSLDQEDIYDNHIYIYDSEGVKLLIRNDQSGHLILEASEERHPDFHGFFVKHMKRNPELFSADEHGSLLGLIESVFEHNPNPYS